MDDRNVAYSRRSRCSHDRQQPLQSGRSTSRVGRPQWARSCLPSRTIKRAIGESGESHTGAQMRMQGAIRGQLPTCWQGTRRRIQQSAGPTSLAAFSGSVDARFRTAFGTTNATIYIAVCARPQSVSATFPINFSSRLTRPLKAPDASTPATARAVARLPAHPGRPAPPLPHWPAAPAPRPTDR